MYVEKILNLQHTSRAKKLRHKKPPPCITIFTSQYAKYPALILSKFLFIEFAQRHVGRFFRQQQKKHTHTYWTQVCENRVANFFFACTFILN